MHRPKRFRRNTHRRSQLSWSYQDMMHDIPPSPTRRSLRSRDTGFPESFCGQRNTTLPHPEANLSPDATLTEDDISVGRAIARHRASFLVDRKTPPSLNLGDPLTLTTASDFCASPASLESADKFPPAIGSLALAGLRGADHLSSQRPGESRSSRDGESVLLSSSGGSSAGSSPTHMPRGLGSGPGRRKSFLRRLTRR